MNERDGDRAPLAGKTHILKPARPVEDPVPGAGFETLCAHFGEDPQEQHGAVTPPIYQSATFSYPDAAAFERRLSVESGRYDYTRIGNPTVQLLESKLARLENGAWADCFASGVGAISAAISACVEAGAHVVAVAQCYAPTRWHLRRLRRFDVTTTFVDSVDPQDFIDALRPETRLIYLESPTSGRFEVPEVEPLARAARERGITTVFDNSWATPYFFRPLDAGIDLVVHSATKYLNGHSDVVAGAVIGRDEALRRGLWEEVELGGAALDPFAAWLMLRGLRTLALRMEHHQRTGLEIARFLEQHPKVAVVRHPGLESHPQHAIAKQQFRGWSGLFSFGLREQSREATHRVIDRCRLFRPAVSWGGHESLIIGGTFFSVDPARPEWLLRLSVGLESTADLIEDLRQALE